MIRHHEGSEIVITGKMLVNAGDQLTNLWQAFDIAFKKDYSRQAMKLEIFRLVFFELGTGESDHLVHLVERARPAVGQHQRQRDRLDALHVDVVDLEAVDVRTAIRAVTIWVAHQMFLEDEIGSLEVGKYADIAVWDRDPYTVDTADLEGMQCVMTVFNGEVVWDAS